MSKIYRQTNIKISLAISLVIVFIISILSLLNDYYASTLMPSSVIASYIIIVFHIHCFLKTLEDGAQKNNLKISLIITAILGFIIILVGLFVGGIVYKFQRCVTVFSIILIPWLFTLCFTYSIYLKKQITYENEICNTKHNG